MEVVETSTDLAPLKELSSVLIREKTDACKNCKYVVLSPEGVELLYATEESGLVNKLLAGKTRSFEMDMLDTTKKVVGKLRRPYTVGPDKMDVSLCGEVVAIVRKEVTFLKPVLSINTHSDQPLFRVKGPVSISAACDFDLYSCDKRRVGKISKRWSGSSGPTDKDNFVIIFPPDLDVSYKIAVIGTAFLIDFLFYLY